MAPARPGRPEDRLTLVLEEQDLHAVQGEGLPEAVRHRVLLLLEDRSPWRPQALLPVRAAPLCPVVSPKPLSPVDRGQWLYSVFPSRCEWRLFVLSERDPRGTE